MFLYILGENRLCQLHKSAGLEQGQRSDAQSSFFDEQRIGDIEQMAHFSIFIKKIVAEKKLSTYTSINQNYVNRLFATDDVTVFKNFNRPIITTV